MEVSSYSPNYRSWPGEWMTKNFVDITYSKAKCKHCQKIFRHTYTTHFKVHMYVHHKDIVRFENEHSNDPRWKYIKLFEDEDMLCIACFKFISDANNINDDHIHKNDIFTRIAENYEDWSWKYSGDYFGRWHNTIKCDICEEVIKITYDKSDLEEHVENCQRQREEEKEEETNKVIEKLL